VLRRGYATVGTDSGHRASPFDAAWALGDPVALELFAVSARHRVLVAAHAIILAHYAAPARRAYFEGHSSGGREALIAAQRHPDDFDGVIARAPALNFTALNLNGNRLAKQLFAAPGGFLPPAAMQAFSRLVLRQCDALDGLEDAIVAHVGACQVDPATLRCPADGGDCLDDAQIDSVRAILADLTLDLPLANGVDGHPGYPPSGAEAASNGWPLWMTGPSRETPAALRFLLQDGFVRYFVAQDADADFLAFDAAGASARLQSLSTLLDATDPDLSPFTAHGGKLILWHGWADYAISARSTERYYHALVEHAGGPAQAEAFARFYLAPGVDHLGGGIGATIVDLLGALDAWVDGGVAPDDLVGYRPQANELHAFRPVCRYPTYARYRGAGDANDASSFECAAP
jgi:feruloyl esterase